MKVTLPRQQFHEALGATSTLTGGRTTKPILGCVKITAEKDKIRLSATDGEAALSISIATLRTSEMGETVVAADQLFNIIREMSDVEVDLLTTERHCIISGVGSEFKIYVHDPADFPPIPEFEGDADLVLDGYGLQRAVALTLYAAARETNRYAINGVLWQKRGDKLHLVATDGRRLARAGGPIVSSKAEDFEVIIPGKALGIFERVFQPRESDKNWHVDVRIMPNQVLMRSGETMLATGLVEGHFPDYDAVIPKDNDKSALMDREEFHSAVRRAALLTTEDSRAVRLAFEEGTLTISSRAPEQGEAKIEMPIEYKGSAVEIGFNPTFLSDSLKVIEWERVEFKLSDGSRPGILKGVDAPDFLYVVMPVALS